LVAKAPPIIRSPSSRTIEHDATVGEILKKVDELGIANNTIVLYTTDDGASMNSWPDGAMTPFRSEKNTNWKGAFRVRAGLDMPRRVRISPLICADFCKS
jgi:arylsulfatase A-like enzyme